MLFQYISRGILSELSESSQIMAKFAEDIKSLPEKKRNFKLNSIVVMDGSTLKKKKIFIFIISRKPLPDFTIRRVLLEFSGVQLFPVCKVGRQYDNRRVGAKWRNASEGRGRICHSHIKKSFFFVKI